MPLVQRDPAGLGGHEHAVALPQLDLVAAWMIGVARDPVEDDHLQVDLLLLGEYRARKRVSCRERSTVRGRRRPLLAKAGSIACELFRKRLELSMTANSELRS